MPVFTSRLHCPSTPPRLHHTNSKVGGSGLGELKGDITASKFLIHLGVGVEPVVDTTALFLIKDDLEGLVAVLLGPEALADNLDGVDEIRQDGIVDGRQSARARALLFLRVARTGRALRARKDAARGED